MNYRHIYHAGNFADVFKHVVLAELLKTLLRKEKPFCYLETHAGIGRYDLQTMEAQKTKEYLSGIVAVYQQTEQLPVEVQAYLQIVKGLNKGAEQLLRYYPGSPCIAQSVLRAQDSMILAELHPEDAVLLKKEFAADKRVSVHQMDGYNALKAFLPPKERRGLVLIDPPFEQEHEVSRIEQGLQTALRRWSSGIFVVWYPLKDQKLIQKLQQKLNALGVAEILYAELSIYPEDNPTGLNGSGLAILNPPWQFDQQLQQFLPQLWQILSPQKTGKLSVTLKS